MSCSTDDIRNMHDLRDAIDAVDGELVDLLTKRAALIDRAVVLKSQSNWPARIPDRVEQVVQNVRRKAEEAGIDPNITEKIWRELIEWSIAREEKTLGKQQ